ncbi:MAG: coproporphyrinogen III oxidase [Bacillota bacterium]
MKIFIKGIDDERFHRPLRLIGNLFFEETELCFTEDDSTLEAEFFFEEHNEGVSIKGYLRTEDGKEFVANKKQQIAAHIEGKDRLRQVKNTLSYVYLTILQDYTGMIQKWGILTGVRPTKLYHKKRQEGMSEHEIHRMFKEEYLLSDEKIQLMQQIVKRQLQVVPDLDSLSNEVSIYIGIPFCPTKCAYCTFPAYAINGRQGSVTSFLGGLHFEIKEIGRWLKEKGIKITTVYYGGGTPTSITAEEMDMLYEEMADSFPDVENIREITVEAGRPDTITKEKLDILNKWKIDRISINPQSYIQQTLKAIGRHHTVEETIEKFHLARSRGMNNINMDLIIGLPGEGVKEFDYTLSETEKLMPESLTVHTLSFKRASEMTKNKHKYKVASREEISTMMDHAVKWTRDHGYAPYYLYRQKNILGNLENVGYALKGQDSIYNIMIMEEQQTIIGIGCGAASKFVHPSTMKITHFANPKDPKSYNDGFKHYTDEKINILEELFTRS